MDLDVAEAGQEVEHRPQRGPPEEEEQAQREGTEERPRPRVTARTRGAEDGAGVEEQRHDREAAVVEEPSREEPAEHLPGTVGVVEERPLVVLAPRRPLAVADEWHEHPRRDQQRRAADEGGPAEPPEEAAACDESPHADGQEREVARDEVTRNRERERRGRCRKPPATCDGAPREPPGERE